MPRTTRIIILSIAVAAVYIALVPRIASSRLPGNNQGYEPAQPISYSHRLHAGELQIDCLYCHSAARRGPNAGIPSTNVCMNCHKFVKATWSEVKAEEDLAKEEIRPPRKLVSPELQKLYDAWDRKEPIQWVRVHHLPRHARFDHSAHVGAGVECQTCHGPIQTMERVRQESTLRMGWCVNCHRDLGAQGIGGKPVSPSTDCSACHY